MSLAHSLSAFTDPTIATRATLAVTAVACAGLGVLALRAVLPRRLKLRTVLVPAAQSAFLYLLLGLGSRFIVQHHRSRLQIVILLAVVALVEIARYRRGQGRPRAATWAAGSVAVCLGVLAAKWALEPGALSDTLFQARLWVERA